MKKIQLGCVVVLGVFLCAYKSIAGGIKEGQWSMHMTVQAQDSMADEMANAQKEMDHMSAEEKAMMQQMMGSMGVQMGGNSMVIENKQCLTNQNPVPKQEDEENCQETHRSFGNTIKFEVVCKDSRSTGEVTYNNDSMKGTIQSIQRHNGKEEKAAIDIDGQYVGPCKG